MANFRPLQPAPMDQEAPLQPQSRSMLPQKPKRTVTLGACVACRKRKSKCDGKRPVCTCCGQKETDCVYELGPNEKPSQAMKRKNEEMQGELSNLRQLYDFLRLRPEHEAMEILRRIRDNPAETSPSQRIQELANFVRHGNLLDPQHTHSSPPPFPREHGQSVTLPSLRLALDAPSNMDSHRLPFPGILSMGVDGPASQRRRFASDTDVSARSGSSTAPPPTSLEAILSPSPSTASDDSTSDPRLLYIRNWTNVTSDTNTLVSLMSAWTTCEYNYYHYLDRDTFLDDVAHGRTDFCSPLLVNALLASACFHSSVVKDREKPFSETLLTTMFYKEARRLWDTEEGQDSLTKLQAGICLFLVLGKHGRDKVGYTFLAEACQIAHRMDLFAIESPSASQSTSHASQTNWQRVQGVTAWALFNFQLTMSFVYAFPVIIDRPPSIAIPYCEDFNSTALFQSECAKHVLILDCVDVILGDSKADGDASKRLEEARTCHYRLTQWWKSRSKHLDPDLMPTRENLLCAMMYHVNIINIFQTTLHGEATTQQSENYYDHARIATLASLKEIHRLLALQQTRHGWVDSITFVLHPITIASFGTLDEISRADMDPRSTSFDSSELYQGLRTCLRALASLTSYSYYAQPLFRLLTQKCQTLGIRLPSEVQATLDSYMTEEWTRNAASLVSSQYIADTHSHETDAENARMDAIISGWEALSLDGTGKMKGPEI
ncbi:hypothetical protein T440DRAFT_516896 [Plenodomus tracheiphilus IPT5]|uniref:Zn(2)-C6 fungal-type domain-containing protein n=1 Tax=Plenodomus tracheiphilus IPT5 TaxID=1408161 RepID=A0A6A7B9P0_9PLEO|nr:hypothetical protein T440DRAFT_516896 [Plenodomus tracheiphilus IPT5]